MLSVSYQITQTDQGQKGGSILKLGEKIKQARLQAGLSQRQLCGEEITRNMLSQIENGTAQPSMKTLQFLASRLGKPVSFFLEDTVMVSPNVEIIVSARRLYDGGDFAGAALVLETYKAPDPIFDREKEMIRTLCHLNMAQTAIEEGREGYALSLLEKAENAQNLYCAPELERRRLLLLGRLRGQQVSSSLPSLDEELLLRAEEALASRNPRRASQLLEAAEDHFSPRFCFLRGQAFLEEKDYASAAECLHGAEKAYPQVFSLLEICYRELGDYKRAYECVCRQRGNSKNP